MALSINLVDYGPLYNALGAQRNAGLLKAQRAANNAELVSGLTGLVTDAAKTIYGIMQQGALEKAKAKTIELETEYSRRIAQGIYTGDINFDAQGNLNVPQELQSWYNAQQSEIEKGLEGYPDVKNWASGQIAQIKQSGTLHALDVASAAAKANREAQGKQVLTGALDQSIAQGKLDPFYAALSGQTWRSSDETAILRQLGEQDFGYRTKEGGIRNLVSVEGYQAGATAVEAWRKSGEVTSEQADSLLNTAANQGKVQGAVFAQQALEAYQKIVDAGGDPEAAVKMVVKGIPEAYGSQTEELLRAAKETAETRADNVADEKMQDFYKGHREDPAGLRAYLDMPQNAFSKAMKRETYMYWDAVIEAVLKKTEPEPPMGPGEKAVWGMFYDPMKTDTMVGTGIQKMVNAGLLDPRLAPEILSKMSQRKTFLNPVVLSGVNVINSTFDLMAEKEKDPAKKLKIQFAQRDVLMNLDKYLGEGPHPDAQISGAVEAFLKPYKADLLKADWWNPATSKEVDVIRGLAWQGRYIPPDQQAVYERYDRDMLETAYGVGKKPGTMIQSSELMDNGMSRFAIVGLNPKHPKDAFYYTFQTDPATGTERLMVLEEIKNAQGQTMGANWMPAVFVNTVTQERAAKIEQGAAAARKAGLTGPEAVRSVAAAVGVEPGELSAEELKRVPAGPLPGAVDVTPAQINKVNVFLRGKKSVGIEDLRKAAALIGITGEQLVEVAKNRGVRVTK
jgi:hypothetical protein